MNEHVDQINKLLLKGEPDNISVDPYTNYTGYQPQFIIDAINEIIGINNWGFEEVENKLVDADENGKPRLAVAKVLVWVLDKENKIPAVGQGRITRGDYGDAQKSAQTDALKKALSYFSIGNRAYRGELQVETKTEQAPEDEEWITAGDKVVMCDKHNVQMMKGVSKTKKNKDGSFKKYYWHKTPEGSMCFGS